MAVRREANGMERCSELVMRLNGAEATDGMFDLVFGRNQGEYPLLPLSTSHTASPTTGG